MRKLIIICFIIVTWLILPPKNYGQNGGVGIDEKLGSYLPLDAKFVTSKGDTVTLKQVIDKPVLLALVYYECPGICSPMLNDLTWAVDRIELEPGADFKVVSISFDPRENSGIAAKWKKNYLHSIKRKFSENDWIFLTGDSTNIKKVTKAVGFNYRPSSDSEYVHPATVIAISPEGKISRYIFGIQFNQFDLKMALLEAKAGKSNPTISKVLQLCYSYSPEGRTYELDVTRIAGVLMLFGLGIFAVTVVFKKKRNNIKNEGVEING